MPKYINADKILSHLNDEIEACGNPDIDNEPIAFGTKLGLLSAKSFIETAEIADVAPVRHGRWIDKGEYAVCTECGVWSGTQYDGVEPIPLMTQFCPNCGAKMEEKE